MAKKPRENKVNSGHVNGRKPDANGQPDAKTPPAPIPEAKPPADNLDPFHPERLRLSGAPIDVKKAFLVVPVQRPNGDWFVRTHPDPAFRVGTMLIQLKDERHPYLVDQELWDALKGESLLRPHLLVLAVNRQRVIFLWNAALPSGGNRNEIHVQTGLEAVERAATTWIRATWNSSLGGYEIMDAQGQLPEPEWNDLTLHEAIKAGFKNHRISSLDHPVLRRLRGEV
jgi:hypothetical protein